MKTDAATSNVTPDQERVLNELAASGIETHVWRPRDFEAVKARLLLPTLNRSDGTVSAAPDQKEQ